MSKLSKSWKRGFDAAKAARNHATAPFESKMMGAAIFSGQNLLSFGFNQYDKTHTDSVGKDFCYSTHAEHKAILKIRHYDKKNLVIYIYRETSFGIASSRPCAQCIEKMKDAGIKRARFYVESGEVEEIKI